MNELVLIILLLEKLKIRENSKLIIKIYTL